MEEASGLGRLTVLLWDDRAVERLTGTPPKFPLAERIYVLNAIRYVGNVIPVGDAASDSLPDIPGLRPEIWADLETSAHETRKGFCRDKGILYRVFKREELSGFPESPSLQEPNQSRSTDSPSPRPSPAGRGGMIRRWFGGIMIRAVHGPNAFLKRKRTFHESDRTDVPVVQKRKKVVATGCYDW
ncbi:MAG TPA: hypothetical protein VGJ73_23155, partial [Verrucomicrobiae bacterium]